MSTRVFLVPEQILRQIVRTCCVIEGKAIPATAELDRFFDGYADA